MSLFPIFKVNKLTDKNQTDTIFVFAGTNLDVDIDEDPNELFKKDPTNDAFQDVFEKDELKTVLTYQQLILL